jgi:hypothetical protein
MIQKSNYCLASKFIHYLDTETTDQPRFLASGKAAKIFNEENRVNCKGIRVLNEQQIDRYIKRQLLVVKKTVF